MGQPIDVASVLIVPDLSQFPRQLKADIDQSMRALQSQVEAAFRQIERGASTAGADVGRDFARGGEQAEGALREVSRTAKVEFAEVEASASRASAGISAKLGGALALVKTSLIGLGVGVVAGLGALTVMGLKSAASMEQTQVAFDSLLGSAEEGKKVFDSLKTFAAVTPFELTDITPLAQKFLAFSGAVGLSKDQLQDFLTTAGNVVSVTGGGAQALDSIGLAFSHISSGGKVSLEDINILSDALPGFSGVAAIAAAQGISTGDAMAAISAGSIDATTGVAALLAGMNKFPGAAGAMEKQSQTLLGVFSTFKDTIGQALTDAFQPAIPAIKDSLGELTPILGDAVSQLAPSLGAGLSAVLPVIGKLIKAIVPILTPILDALGPVLDAIAPSLQPLGEALGQLVVALAPVLPVVAQFIAVLAQLAIPIILLLAQVLLPLTPILNYMALAIGEVAKALGMIDWAAVGEAIGHAFVVAWTATKDFVVNAAAAIFGFGAKVGTAVREFVDSVILKFFEIVNWVKGLPGRLLDALGNFGALLYQKGKDLISGLWEGIKSAGSWLYNLVKNFVYDNTVGAAKAILGIHSPSTVFAAEVGTQIPAGVAQGVQAGLPDLQNLLSPIVPSSGNGQGTAAMGGLGGIIVNVNFVGVVPTADEARRTGQAAGDGVMAAVARRSIGLAVRNS